MNPKSTPFLNEEKARRLVAGTAVKAAAVADRSAPSLNPDSQLVARFAGKPVVVRLLDGAELAGGLITATRFEVWLDRADGIVFVAKHAIATISRGQTS